MAKASHYTSYRYVDHRSHDVVDYEREHRERVESLKRMRLADDPKTMLEQAEALDRDYKAEREAERIGHRVRQEKRLELDDRIPSWMRLSEHKPYRWCGRSIENLIDADGNGTCRRPEGHDGRHIACTGTMKIIGIGPWREKRGAMWVYYDRRGNERHGAETKHHKMLTARSTGGVMVDKVAVKAAKVAALVSPTPEPPPEEPKVGKPCPEHLVLDQGEKRCTFYGAKLDHLMCSRPNGHEGKHVATDTDAKGSQVLAICNPT